jgi:DNA polymerase III epsilon subunit-like protein
MKAVVFDTETSGFPSKKLAPNASNQARILQLVWILVERIEDEEYLVKKARNAYFQVPSGFQVPLEASRIHGITLQLLHLKGEPARQVLEEFACDLKEADGLGIAHNSSFDISVLELARLQEEMPEDFPAFSKTFCTMKAMTDVCKIQGRYGRFKWPTLAEAYKFCTGEEMRNAHEALADVNACWEVYQYLKRRKAHEESLYLSVLAATQPASWGMQSPR